MNPLEVYALSTAASSFAEGLVSPYYPLFIASLSTSPLMVGLLNSLSSFALIVSQALGGMAGDSIGRRRPFIILGYTAKGLFYLIIARATSMGQLIPLQAAQSFFFGMQEPNNRALLAELTAPQRRSLTAAVLATVGGIATLPGIFLGKYLVDKYGVRSIFYSSAVFLIMSALLFLFLMEKAQKKKRITLITREAMRELKKNRALSYLFIGSFVWALGVHMVSPLIPPVLLVAKLGFAQKEMAVLSIVSTATALSLTIPFGIKAEKHGAKPFVVFAYVIGTVIIIGYLFAQTVTQVAALVFLASLAGAASAGAMFALLSELTPKEVRGSLMGLFYVAIGIMQAIAPALGGLMWNAYGMLPTFALSASFHAIGAWIVYRGG